MPVSSFSRSSSSSSQAFAVWFILRYSSSCWSYPLRIYPPSLYDSSFCSSSADKTTAVTLGSAVIVWLMDFKSDDFFPFNVSFNAGTIANVSAIEYKSFGVAMPYARRPARRSRSRADDSADKSLSLEILSRTSSSTASRR